MSDTAKAMKSLFNSIDKINENATTMDDDSLAKISGWLSTGYYGLNAVISADVFKGIPKGRITTLFGPSQSGKSLLSANIQKAAQDEGMSVILFDSEFDKDGRMESSFGVDTSKVKTLPVETVEELIVQSTKILTKIIENNLHGKVLLILDSLGALSTKKEVEDAEGKSKVAMDMGLKAKLVKSFYKTMKAKCAISKCPFLIINHEIADPSQMYESNFKSQGGGQAIEFFSTVMVHVGKRKERQDTNNEFDTASILTKGGTTGQTMRFFTQKNRCAIPHKEMECYLNFVNGIDKYSGLKPLLDLMDNLYLKDAKGEKGKGLTWYLQTDKEERKLGRFSEWRNDDEIWSHILPELNKVVAKELSFKEHF